jgi:hypothetical protein
MTRRAESPGTETAYPFLLFQIRTLHYSRPEVEALAHDDLESVGN